MNNVTGSIHRKEIGIVTMGTGDSERMTDVTEVFGKETTVHITGIVDGYSYEYIRENFWPEKNESFIVSKIRSNKDIMISGKKAKQLVDLKVKEFENNGIYNVLIFCTGHFERIETKGIMAIPEKIIYGLLEGLRVSRVGIIVPEKEQIDDSLVQYSVFNPIIRAASPYKDIESIARAAKEFRNEDVELIVTDCMGFNEAMGKVVQKESNKKVIVPRVFIPRIINSMI